MKKITKIALAFLTVALIILGLLYFAHVDESTSKLIKAENNIDADNIEEEPGWELVFAIVPLIAIAYLVLRQRE